MYGDFSDAELIKRAASDDRNAFALLYKRYMHNLYNYVFSLCHCKETSEEIIQNIFLNIWIKRKALHPEFFKAYIYRSAKNAIINHLKANDVAVKAREMITIYSSPFSESVEETVVYHEYLQRAQQAITLLPNKRKQIFELRVNEDMSLDEIASKLNISKSVVKKQFYAGMDFVRKYIFKHTEITIILLTLYKKYF